MRRPGGGAQVSGARGLWRSAGLSLLAVGLFVGSIATPAVAVAQEGPRFSNWGPGMSPPEDEGVEPMSSGSTVPSGAPSSPAAPNAAPAPGAVAPPPGPVRSACQYDLRGTWRNQGRETSGQRRSYSASVYVQQYRSYIYAQQDDGTSYYGRCVGSQLQFDVYAGYRFVGYQDGSISGDRLRLGGTPPSEAPTGAPSAVAPPPPDGGTGARATFTWSTWYGWGTETWTKQSLTPIPLGQE